MKKYTLIAIDDEEPAVQLIEWYASQLVEVEFLAGFTSPAKALDFLKNNQVDLVVLDIQMSQVNGLEIAASLERTTKLIFSTAFDQYAIEGFNYSAVDFLLKPYSLQRFETAVNKAVRLIELETVQARKTEDFIVVKVNYANRKILVNEILFAESLNNDLYIHLITGEQLKFRESLNHFITLLPQDQFIRVHRSFIVSLQHIEAYNQRKLTLGDREIPVSSSYRKIVSEKLN